MAVLALIPGTHCAKEEDKLLNRLLSSYQKHGKPGELDEAVEVKYGMSLIAIKNYDPKTYTITINVWEYYQWKDERLAWKEDSYGGLGSIRLPPDTIWTPDITPYNGWVENEKLTNIVIYPNGLCSWVPKKIMSFPCFRNLTETNCSFKFGSWTYDGNKLNLTNRADEIDTNTFTSNEYKLTETSAVRSVKTYECCPEPYIDITYTLGISPKDATKP